MTVHATKLNIALKILPNVGSFSFKTFCREKSSKNIFFFCKHLEMSNMTVLFSPKNEKKIL